MYDHQARPLFKAFGLHPLKNSVAGKSWLAKHLNGSGTGKRAGEMVGLSGSDNRACGMSRADPDLSPPTFTTVPTE